MENAKVENSCQKRCPKCGDLPRQYKARGQCPLGGSHIFTPESLWDLIFSPLHVGLRSVDGLLRSSSRHDFTNFSACESTKFFNQTLSNICFDFLKCSKLRKNVFFDQFFFFFN